MYLLVFLLVGILLGELFIRQWDIAPAKEKFESDPFWLYMVAVFMWPILLLVWFFTDGNEDA